MPDPNAEPKDAAAPPTCEELLRRAEEGRESLPWYKEQLHSLGLAAVVGAAILLVNLYSRDAALVFASLLILAGLLCGVVVLGVLFVEMVRVALDRKRKYEGGWLHPHVLSSHYCFVKNDACATATGELVVTPRFIALVKSEYLTFIPFYSLGRPLQNRAQCIPLTPETRVGFSDPTRIIRTVYRLDVTPGGLSDGDHVYLWPKEIRKLAPVLARLGVEVSCPRDL